jgi:quercetin dioxygenase-like cupin family protein
MNSHIPIKVIPKGWGHEKIIVNNDQYCGKLLYIIKGCKTSLHYHKSKHETFYVESGKAMVYYSDEVGEIIKLVESKNEQDKMLLFAPGSHQMTTITLKAGDRFEVPRQRVHRIMALEDTKLYEFSTHHEDADSVRLIQGDVI